MDRTIWKYNLQLVDDEQTLNIPNGDLLLVAVQFSGVISLWFDVCPGIEPTPRHFRVFGTGHPIPTRIGDHVGSVIDHPFVWHVYEVA